MWAGVVLLDGSYESYQIVMTVLEVEHGRMPNYTLNTTM
jgi:hypothetical protein